MAGKTCSRAGEVYTEGCDPIDSRANINQCPCLLGGRCGYLRGFGHGPKPMSTTRSTRTDSEDGEHGALRATVERLQNENATRSQEIEQMKNNQVAMQRQMEEMMRLVARVTGSDMMTQGRVLTSWSVFLVTSLSELKCIH
ncbi:hypothetical protein AAC387_Pa09g0821 [Persea americana]